MSLPLTARWEVDMIPEEGSSEADLLDVLQRPGLGLMSPIVRKVSLVLLVFAASGCHLIAHYDKSFSQDGVVSLDIGRDAPVDGARSDGVMVYDLELDSAARDSAARDSAAPDSAARDSAAPDSAAPDSAARDSAARDSAAPDSAARDSAARDSAARDSAAPDSGAPDSAADVTLPPACVAGFTPFQVVWGVVACEAFSGGVTQCQGGCGGGWHICDLEEFLAIGSVAVPAGYWLAGCLREQGSLLPVVASRPCMNCSSSRTTRVKVASYCSSGAFITSDESTLGLSTATTCHTLSVATSGGNTHGNWIPLSADRSQPGPLCCLDR
jgi:hypothetical protein